MENDPHDKKVKSSTYFVKAKAEAKEMIQSNDKLKGLLIRVRKKLNDQGDKNLWKELIEVVNTFVRMTKFYINGHYKEIPWKSLLMIVAGLLYFINPFDLIPDFIPAVGFLDDLTLLVWIYKSLKMDIEAFKIWEKGLTQQTQ